MLEQNDGGAPLSERECLWMAGQLTEGLEDPNTNPNPNPNPSPDPDLN